MATSGVIPQSFGGHFRLQLEWTSTQNAAAGTSTITARLYLMSLSSYTSISSSTPKTFRITMGGLTSETTGNLNLSPNQKKLLHTYTRTIAHDSNGKLDVLFAGYMEWGLSINGHTSDVTVSRIDSLPTLSTASTVGSVTEWRAGNSMTVSVSRKSTSYTHTVHAYVDGIKVAYRTGVGTGVTFNFTEAEYDAIFRQIGTRSSAPAEIRLETFSGSTKIGGITKKSVVILAGLPATYDSTMTDRFTIGDPFTVKLRRSDDKFTHYVELIRNGVRKAIITMEPGVSWQSFYTSGIASYLYDELGTKEYITLTLRTQTRYKDQVIREPVDMTIRAYPNKEDLSPTFTGDFTVAEVDPAVGSLVGAGNYVSGVSDIKVTVPTASLAQAHSSTHIANYTISIGNTTETVQRNPGDTAPVEVMLKDVKAFGKTTVTITAMDGRGLTASQSKEVNFILYSPPRINASAKRVGSFEDATEVSFAASISPITVGGTAKNSIVRKRFRYRKKSVPTWGTWKNLSNSPSEHQETIFLDNTESYIFEFEVSDRVSSVVSTQSVAAGKPAFFIDSEKLSVGVGKFPSRKGTFETPLAYIDELFIGRILTENPQFTFDKPVVAPEFKGKLSNSRDLELIAGSRTWTFGTDGRVEFPNYNMKNGANLATMLPLGPHNDPMMIQTKKVTVNVSGGDTFVDILFDVPFSVNPDWIIATPRDANAVNSIVGVYNYGPAGCRIHVAHRTGFAGNWTSYVQVVAGGKKS